MSATCIAEDVTYSARLYSSFCQLMAALFFRNTSISCRPHPHEARKLANFPALKPQILPGSLQTDSGRGISFRYLIYKSCHSVVQKIFNLVCSDKHTYLLTYLCFQFQSWLYNAIVGLKSTILLQISYERLLSRIVAIIHKSYIDV